MRSQVIGMILGSMALGVLLGYPFGGIMYAFSGKSAPFYIIAILTFAILGELHNSKKCKNHQTMVLKSLRNIRNSYVIVALQLVYVDFQSGKVEPTTKDGNYLYFLADPIIAKIFAAILISTIAMATLEPCLPIWLMSTLKPEVCKSFESLLQQMLETNLEARLNLAHFQRPNFAN